MKIDQTAETEYTQPLTHTKLKKLVTQYLDVTRENNDLARRDRDYYDGAQISASMRAELQKRGQPPIYDNKIFSAMSGLFGLIDAGETDPEAWPRTGSGKEAADVATKTLRFVADKADFKRVRKAASESFLIEGPAAAIMGWDGRKVTCAPIYWADLIYDPFSRDHDFADAKFMGVGKLLDVEDVKLMFPEAYTRLKEPTGDMSSWYDDANKMKWWGDQRRQVRVVDLYYDVGGEWHRAIFVEAGMLYAGPSEYHDDDGVTINPIKGTTFEVSREGDRYGAVRNMVPLQDEVNARRSKLLHHVNHRQVQITDPMAAQTDKEIARREASKADGVIPFGYAASSAPDLAQGQMMILQASSASLDRMAPTPAVLGRVTGTGESGRSRQILQQAGYMEMSRRFGRFEDFEHACYRTMWHIAREYLDQPQWVRIVDNPKAPEFLQINEPVMGMVMAPVIGSDGQPVIDPMTGRPAMRPIMGVTGMKNRLAELDMDILISTVPDTVTLQQEVFSKIMETVGSTGLDVFDPRFKVYLEMSGLPNAREVMETIERAKAEAEQQGAEVAAAQQQAQDAAQQVELAVKGAKATKDSALAQKAQAETAMIIAPALHQPGYGQQAFPGY